MPLCAVTASMKLTEIFGQKVTMEDVERYVTQSLSIILKLRHQRPKATPVVKYFFWLKSMLKEHKNYVVKYFCPKLFQRLVIIKSPLVLILN